MTNTLATALGFNSVLARRRSWISSLVEWFFIERDNEKIIQVADECIQHLRNTAFALLEAGADFSFVKEVLTAAQVLQESTNHLCEPEPMRSQSGAVVACDAEVPTARPPIHLN
jgi:hypothetical protein